MNVQDGRYLFGRVVSVEARAGWSMPGSILIYVYRSFSEELAIPSRTELTPENLLVPPMMTNTRPWSMGYFETVTNTSLAEGDLLPTHCFRSSSGKYYDEFCNELPREVPPCGGWGLHSYRTIDDEVGAALGIAPPE